MLAASKRGPKQKDALFEHYLATRHDGYRQANASFTRLEAEQNAIKARSPITHVQEERKDTMPMANILMRGQYDKVGEKVEAAVPVALGTLPADAPKNRLGLAKWLVSDNNTLTARVTVNRMWQELFGRGLVVTSEDFGIMGSAPSHPELLDWLAVDFRESGWDVKRLYKMLVTSAAYRQATLITPEKLDKDRDNALLSRGPRFRMDAEMIRDYALAVSGTLSPAWAVLERCRISLKMSGKSSAWAPKNTCRTEAKISTGARFTTSGSAWPHRLAWTSSMRQAVRSAACAATARTRRCRPW